MIIQNLWAAVMASRRTKVGGGIVAGGATFALVMNLLGARLDDLDKKIEAKDKEIRTYVDLKHDSILLQLQYMNSREMEMTDLLKVINQRMYEEHKQNKGEK